MRFVFLLLFFFNFTYSQQIDSTLHTKKQKTIEIGLSAFFKNDSLTLKNSYKKLLDIYKSGNDSIILAKYYQYKAMFHQMKYKKDSAYYYYHQSKNISLNIKDSLEVGKRLLSIGLLQRDVKDYLGAEINLINSLHFLEPIESNIYLERTYNSLGLISDQLNQVDDAIKYYNKSLKLNSLNENNIGLLYIINNIGLLYQNQNEHKKAITYFKQGLSQDSIKEKYPIQYAFLLENLAYSSYMLGKKRNVLNQYEKVLKIREKRNNLSDASITQINLSNYYKDLKQNKKAFFHSNKALKYAKQTHNNKKWLEALENLSNLTTGEQSKKYLQEYITLNDSLFQKERLLKNQFAKIRYETDKKEKENTILKTDNEKKQAEITYQKQQKTIGWLAAASGILLFGLSVMFFFQRRRKLLFQAQLERVQAREHERKQIAKSLHDEVAGDLRLLHQKLEKSNLLEEAQKLDTVKDNVRNLSHQLSSVSFDKVSFKDQIINLVSDYFELDFRIMVTGLQEYEWQTN